MAIAIKEKRAVRGMEAVAERPDGTRVSFELYPTPIFNSDGDLTGAVNMLIDITDRKRAEQAKQHLAAIVEFSDDAIISIDLHGIIQSWNSAAERIYGYTVREATGKSVDILIPPDRSNEEPEILNRIRGGRHIEHYETVRVRKDGSLIDISLTVSPVMDGDGRVIGASKIARDITERRKAQEQRDLGDESPCQEFVYTGAQRCRTECPIGGYIEGIGVSCGGPVGRIGAGPLPHASQARRSAEPKRTGDNPARLDSRDRFTLREYRRQAAAHCRKWA